MRRAVAQEPGSSEREEVALPAEAEFELQTVIQVLHTTRIGFFAQSW